MAQVPLSPTANIILSARVKAVDDLISSSGLTEELQMAILMVAHTLTFRRLCKRLNVSNRGQRMKLIRTATEEFNKKLRELGLEPDAAEAQDHELLHGTPNNGEAKSS